MDIEKHDIELERRVSSPGLEFHDRSRRPSFFVEEGDQIIPLKIVGADNEEILPEDIAAAPDGGWGWVIVFAAFSISFIYGGVIFSFGVMLDAIVESSLGRNAEFDVVSGNEVTVSQIATIGACLVSSSLFFGPFSAALVNKFGFRPVAITGSFVMSSGFAASWFFCRDGIPNIPALLLLNGVIGGIGLSLVSIPSIIIIGFWFEEKRALATGIALCGSGVGTCAFPPIMSALIATFGWQGALLAQAGLLLSMSLFAMLFRPLDPTKNSLEKKVEERLSDLPEDGAEHPVENIPLTSERPRCRITHQISNCVSIAEESEISDDRNPDNGDIQPEISHQEMRPKFVRLHSLGNLRYNGSGSGVRRKSSLTAAAAGFAHPRRISLALPPPNFASSFDGGAVEHTRILRVESKDTFNRPMNRDDIFYRGSIHQIKELPEHLNNLNMVFVNSQLGDIESSIPEEDQAQDEELTTRPKNLTLKEKLKQKLQVVLKMLNVGLMKSPMFLMLCFMCGFALVGLFVPFVYLIGLSQEKGCTLEEGTSLISIIGIADTVGRIIIGTVATKVGNHVVAINNAALTIGGIATLLTPFFESYTTFVVYACVFGLANASISSLRSIIIVELLGLARLTNAFGLTLFCEGIATLFGSPLMGFLKDTTGTYDVTFYAAGGFMLAAGLICYPIYNVKDWEEKGESEKIEY